MPCMTLAMPKSASLSVSVLYDALKCPGSNPRLGILFIGLDNLAGAIHIHAVHLCTYIQSELDVAVGDDDDERKQERASERERDLHQRGH